jgi:hypothetical protein
LVKLLVSAVFLRREVQIHDVKEDYRDLRSLGEAVDQFKYLERTPRNIDGEKDSFRFHDSKCSRIA